MHLRIFFNMYIFISFKYFIGVSPISYQSKYLGLVFTSDASSSTRNTRRRIYLLLISVYCSNKRL